MYNRRGDKRMKIHAWALGLGVICAGSTANAGDFSAADAMFEKRGTKASDSANFDHAVEAIAAYDQALSQSAGDNKALLHATVQKSRLSIYAGGMLWEHDTEARKQLLRNCVNDADKIADSGQQYYYFKVGCMAALAKIASLIERLVLATKLRNLQDAAIASTTEAGVLVGGYEGGGILRVFAGIRGNPKAKPFGLYDPQEGVEYARTATKAPEQENHPFEAMTGEDYYENFYYLAFALGSLAVEKREISFLLQAKEALEKAINIYDALEAEGELPSGRDPELRYYRREMESLHGYINACEKESDWHVCLGGKLS